MFCRIVGSSSFKGQHFRCTGQNIGDERAYLLQPNVNYLLINSVRRFPDNKLDFCYLELLSGGKDVQCQLIWAPDAVQRNCITYDVVGDEKLVNWPVAVELADNRITISLGPCERTRVTCDTSFKYIANKPQSRQAQIANFAFSQIGKPCAEYQNGPQSYSPIGLILASLHSVGLNFSGNYCQMSRLGRSVTPREA